MLIDAAKGIEDRTRKLFEVCRMRKLPIFTFTNKMDRPSLTPFEIIDQVRSHLPLDFTSSFRILISHQLEKEFQLECCPMNWPIGDGEEFQVMNISLYNVLQIANSPGILCAGCVRQGESLCASVHQRGQTEEAEGHDREHRAGRRSEGGHRRELLQQAAGRYRGARFSGQPAGHGADPGATAHHLETLKTSSIDIWEAERRPEPAVLRVRYDELWS